MPSSLDKLFEHLSDTQQAAEKLVDQINSLIEDAELVHDRIEDVMAAEPLEIPVVIQQAGAMTAEIKES